MQRLSHPAVLLSIGFIFLVVAAFFLIPVSGPVHAQGGAALTANAPASVNRCAGFDVTLTADFGSSQGGGWETDLGYDSTKLVYDKVTPTTWLSNGGTRDVGLLGPIHSLGTVSLGQYSYKTTTGVTGAGDVATVRFLAAGAGAANFTLSQAQFADPAANGTTPAMNGDSIQINNVANCAPFIDPLHYGGHSGQTSNPTAPIWITVTTKYRDLDGPETLKAVYLQIRNPNTGLAPVFAQYWQEVNRLYLLDTSTKKWRGGRVLGDPNEGSVYDTYAILNARESSKSWDPDTKTLTVNWVILLRDGGLVPDGRYYLRLFARDMNKATSGWIGGIGYIDITN